jgi:hypothetical protein
VVVPVECQVRDAGPGSVTVLLLTDFVSAAPGSPPVTQVSVFPVAVHWARGDWKVLPTPAKDYSGLTATPGSPQAASLGWLPLAWGRS